MAISVGILSTFPPTQCGLATFSQALVKHLSDAGARVGVVRIVDTPAALAAPVVHHLVIGEHGSAAAAAAVLDTYDVAVVQHEYGIFGGSDGQDVLDVMRRVQVPVITVLHTVLTAPTPHQHDVLAEVVRESSAVVTMTATARDRLVQGWRVDPARITVISHGAEENLSPDGASTPNAVPVVLTWGLLGAGKGIEWALDAVGALRRTSPQFEYHVVGETHPRVVEREGQRYRIGLERQVRDLGLSDIVHFDGRYQQGPALRAMVRSADVVLLPYDSRDQVTSGVLIEAVVAGRPVVSTRFPHAVELLSGGAGLLVPQRDPRAIAAALHRLLSDPVLAAHTAAHARALAPSLLWPAVAERYLDLGQALLGRRARLDLTRAGVVTVDARALDDATRGLSYA